MNLLLGEVSCDRFCREVHPQRVGSLVDVAWFIILFIVFFVL